MKSRFSRPAGRFFYWPLLIALVALTGVGDAWAATKTMVQDTVYRADGSTGSGTLLITWPGFTSADGDVVAAGSMTVKIGADGRVSTGLVPNTSSNPSSSYKVVLRMGDGTTSEEYWTVPATTSTTIAAIRSKVVPTSVAQQFVGRDYVDTKLAAVPSTLVSNTFTAPQTDAALHTFQAGITGTGTTGSIALGSGATESPNRWTALQTFNGGLVASTLNAVQVVGQGGNATVQAAIDALPSSGGTVQIPAGTFNCGITITKPVRLVGAGSGGLSDNTTYDAFTAGTLLRNTSTSADCITVSVPASNSLGGVVIENLWIMGNKSVSGATAGDNLVIAGGNAANKNLRHVTVRNVLSTDAKGNNLTIKDNAYMLTVQDSQFYRAAGVGISIAATSAGMPSQVAFYSVTSDLNAGDALKISGAGVHDVHAFRSTFADSANGVSIEAGSTNAVFSCEGCNFESNVNAGVLIKDGYGHSIQNSSFPSDGILKYGVYLDPPPGANFVNQQLSLANNVFGSNLTKDVYISANTHVATIWPNSPSNYTYQDLSGTAQQMLAKTAETDLTGTLKVAGAISIGGGALLYSTSQSGTGAICMTTNCSMTTPNLGAASASSLSASGAVSAASMTVSAAASSATLLTATNCASTSGSCGSAAAGRVTIAASATTVTIATTAVTANSEIFIQEDRTLNTALGVTCNTTSGRSYVVSTRTAGTSFVVTASAAPTTTPACLSFRIVN